MSGTIRRLSQQAGAVAAGSDGEKIPIRSRDEIGRLAGSFNIMIDGLKERDTIRNTFGRYVDPDFARALLRRPEAGRLGGKRQEVAILMADIRGFTPLAERLSPEATIEVLNRFFSAIIPLIQRHRGIIVDFIGDAILAFFEPIDESMTAAVRRCACCAFDMHAAMRRLNGQMTGLDIPALKMGIGINSGPVVVGNIGSETRKKYGIVGAAVNITQRIQGRSEAGEVLVSHPVWDMIKSQVTVKREFLTALKGVSPAVHLYAVVPNDAHQIEAQRN
jgi:class 3 adenylate cyclase